MNHYTADEVQEALRPIASLISKSEKAQQKLAPETWQHNMLRDNLRGLRIASTLMTEGTEVSGSFERADLEAALSALESMANRTENTQTKFSPGTSQHTLQRNRLKALRIAESSIKRELGKG